MMPRFPIAELQNYSILDYTLTFSIHSATCTFQPSSFVIVSRSWDDAAGSPCTR